MSDYGTCLSDFEDLLLNLLYILIHCPASKLTKVVQIQGYSYDQRLEYVDIDFNVPHTPIVGLGQ